MKHTIILLALFSFPAYSIDLEFVNHTGADMRISDLRDKCSGTIITNDKPVHIKNGESYVAHDVVAVVHTYTICGSGLCSSSAIGVNNASKYELEVVLRDGVLIDIIAKPDHWSTSNFTCK